MTPYSGLLFFYILGLLLIPAVLLGLLGKSLKGYGLFFSLVMLAVIFAENRQILTLACFYLWQMALCTLLWRYRTRSRGLLHMAVALSVLPLALVKLGEAFPPLSGFQLLGISYMTFRAVQLLLDIYDGGMKELFPLEITYFLLFFPSVSSGPIDRYRRFLGDLGRKLDREAYVELLRRGIWKLVWGAFSAVAVSGLIWRNWLALLPETGLWATLSYMYGYTFFLFFNFAGYSSMAIGTAYILGISLPENFHLPFLSVDMKDFWGRWHISLSSWLRDYVYARFVRASLKAKRFHNPRTASYLGYLLNMMVMGVWHGLSLHYLAYGAYHGLLLCVNEGLDLHWKAFRGIKQKGWGQAVCLLVTFHLFAFGLLIFSGRIL